MNYMTTYDESRTIRLQEELNSESQYLTFAISDPKICISSDRKGNWTRWCIEAKRSNSHLNLKGSTIYRAMRSTYITSSHPKMDRNYQSGVFPQYAAQLVYISSSVTMLFFMPSQHLLLLLLLLVGLLLVVLLVHLHNLVGFLLVGIPLASL